MDNKAKYWIDNLDLIKHPEGGWFNEIYRNQEKIKKEHLPKRFEGDRNLSTSIYFLLSSYEFSAFHRIKQDEIWYYHDGSSLTLHIIDLNGAYFKFILGKDILAGQKLQHVVRAGWLFAASVDAPEFFTLVGCNVAPGFDFDDFEIPGRQNLIEQYPQHKSIIKQFTK